MPGPKPLLSNHIRERLLADHGSIANGAGALGIAYERLKKAIQTNKFNPSDLERLGLPDLDTLRREYQFDETRPYAGTRSAAATVGGDEGVDAALRPLYNDHAALKKITERSELSLQVFQLYGSWIPNLNMVLFLHATSTPVEWMRTSKAARRELRKLVKELPAVIVYCFECSDQEGEDEIDRQYKNFIKWMEEEDGALEASAKGLIIFLRVPQCPFCMPHQKPTLFTWEDPDSDIALRAITTVEVPKTTDGHVSSGKIIVPLMRHVADDMVEQIERITDTLKRAGDEAKAYRIVAYPDCGQNVAIDRVRGII